MRFRNCWCATLFESQANEGNKGNAAFLFFRGKDSERTSKRSNNEKFYVKVKLNLFRARHQRFSLGPLDQV